MNIIDPHDRRNQEKVAAQVRISGVPDWVDVRITGPAGGPYHVWLHAYRKMTELHGKSDVLRAIAYLSR